MFPFFSCFFFFHQHPVFFYIEDFFLYKSVLFSNINRVWNAIPISDLFVAYRFNFPNLFKSFSFDGFLKALNKFDYDTYVSLDSIVNWVSDHTGSESHRKAIEKKEAAELEKVTAMENKLKEERSFFSFYKVFNEFFHEVKIPFDILFLPFFSDINLVKNSFIFPQAFLFTRLASYVVFFR